MCDHDSPRLPGHEDEIAQQGVLSLILTEHPTLMADYEIVKEVGPRDEDSALRAIRDLVGVGLLRREGASVLPTRAALRFDQIDCG